MTVTIVFNKLINLTIFRPKQDKKMWHTQKIMSFMYLMSHVFLGSMQMRFYSSAKIKSFGTYIRKLVRS